MVCLRLQLKLNVKRHHMSTERSALTVYAYVKKTIKAHACKRRVIACVLTAVSKVIWKRRQLHAVLSGLYLGSDSFAAWHSMAQHSTAWKKHNAAQHYTAKQWHSADTDTQFCKSYHSRELIAESCCRPTPG